MAKSKNHTKKLSYITLPTHSQVIDSVTSSTLQSLLVPQNKSSKTNSSSSFFGISSYKSPRLWFLAIFLCGLFGMLKLGLKIDTLIPFSPYPCVTSQSQDLISNGYSKSGPNLNDEVKSLPIISNGISPISQKDEIFGVGEEKSDESSEFWKQPDGLGYRPCLQFTRDYKRQSEAVVKERTKYLSVVVS